MENSSKPGPVPGPEMKTTSVNIPPHLLEWAKRQPGGLSSMVRDCLETKYKASLPKQEPTPTE